MWTKQVPHIPISETSSFVQKGFWMCPILPRLLDSRPLVAACRALVLLDMFSSCWGYLNTLSMEPSFAYITTDPELVRCIVFATCPTKRITMLIFLFITTLIIILWWRCLCPFCLRFWLPWLLGKRTSGESLLNQPSTKTITRIFYFFRVKSKMWSPSLRWTCSWCCCWWWWLTSLWLAF